MALVDQFADNPSPAAQGFHKIILPTACQAVGLGHQIIGNLGGAGHDSRLTAPQR